MASQPVNDSTAYKKTALKRYPAVQQRETAEARYWRRFKRPAVHSHQAPCTSIHFSPVAPFDLAVTTSLSIKTYNKGGTLAKKTMSRFSDVAFSGRWRHDGRLIAAGGNEGIVRTFEASSATALRNLRGHTAPVHTVRWSIDGLRLLSGSDDKTVRLWDVPTETVVGTRDGHEDYVRSVVASPTSPDTWAAGSYDHSVRVWDMRQSNSDGPVFGVDHGAPVEDLLFMPGGSILISAGGNTLKVWDVLKGGKLVQTLSNHQKTITCVCLDGTETRLLSGSLDGHVKIYSVQTYAVTHGLKYQAPIVSMAISPDNTHLVVGTTDNAVTIRQREVKAAEQRSQRAMAPEHLKGGTARYFARGKNVAPSAEDFQVTVQRKQRLKPYDSALRKFRYHDALDSALTSRNPVVVVTVLEEMMHRGGLSIALSGRDEAALEPLLSFLARYTTNPRYAPLLIDVCSVVFGLYTPVLGQSEAIDELFTKLSKTVKTELTAQKKMLEVVGCLDAVMSSERNVTTDTAGAGVDAATRAAAGSSSASAGGGGAGGAASSSASR
mmetsp:Transcript_100971/g.289918  ORF Transcript_100971/g.289918 Transcript_100971/m.289918 type:complete len:550 (+) Transcript_100971:360-2009(+)|eukprot:CAMPEP_0119475098 /NCGR_PEP_ID=MMETSP1344-20130328/6115_1 /TAXON_ID=236787 /ORGANISM="Florenciella parvula, Strain CCMP2471" /LENGTH=549 /DNA_ID=CAMNT_0007508547 /DNA_START=592 /DNA_END=2241 /DNA_ORIENTATION=+